MQVISKRLQPLYTNITVDVLYEKSKKFTEALLGNFTFPNETN